MKERGLVEKKKWSVRPQSVGYNNCRINNVVGNGLTVIFCNLSFDLVNKLLFHPSSVWILFYRGFKFWKRTSVLFIFYSVFFYVFLQNVQFSGNLSHWPKIDLIEKVKCLYKNLIVSSIPQLNFKLFLFSIMSFYF